MWFEVPLPFFLRDHVYGLGWERVAVGAMLAVSNLTTTLTSPWLVGWCKELVPQYMFSIHVLYCKDGHVHHQHSSCHSCFDCLKDGSPTMCMHMCDVASEPTTLSASLGARRLAARLLCWNASAVTLQISNHATPSWCCCAGFHHPVWPGSELDTPVGAATLEAEPSQQVSTVQRSSWAHSSTGFYSAHDSCQNVAASSGSR